MSKYICNISDVSNFILLNSRIFFRVLVTKNLLSVVNNQRSHDFFARNFHVNVILTVSRQIWRHEQLKQMFNSNFVIFFLNPDGIYNSIYTLQN